MRVFRNPIIQMKNSNLSWLHFLIDYMFCICRSLKAIFVSDTERMLKKKNSHMLKMSFWGNVDNLFKSQWEI